MSPCSSVAQAAPLSAKYHASGSGGQPRNSGIVGFRSDNSQNIFDVLRAQGGCCDCEILCNVPLSRDYTIGGSKGQRSGSTDRLTADHPRKSTVKEKIALQARSRVRALQLLQLHKTLARRCASRRWFLLSQNQSSIGCLRLRRAVAQD